MSLHWTEEDYKAFLERRARENTSSVRQSRTPSPQGEGMVTEKKRSKYGNKKVEVNGMKFDSIHEASVYGDLLLRKTTGEILCILRQVPFDLPGGIVYKADFVVIGNDMKVEDVIDAKSEITRKDRVYINKKKQIKALYGIEIHEI